MMRGLSILASGVILNEIITPSYSFTLPSTSSNHYLKQQYTASSSSSSSTCFVASKETSNNDIKVDDEDLWWKSFELKDEDLPNSVRSQFPILAKPLPSTDPTKETPLIYLDSAATSQKPTFVTSALTDYYETINSNVHRGAHTLSREATQKYEKARDTIASFIQANNRREVVFTSGATEALNLVATTYGRKYLKEGDEVIVSVMEHHSNIVPWQILKEELGIVLKFIPLTSDKSKLDIDVLENELLSEKTKFVSMQHASNVMGCIHPLDQIIPMIRSKASPDCKIMIDACQSVPHQPVNVQQYDIDFLAASGHKVCGPTGIGFLWGKEDILNSMPPYQGGGEMIEDVFLEYSTFAKCPGRFEAGTPAIAQAIGFGAALEYMNSIEGGMERVHQYELELGRYMYRRMKELEGVRLLGPVLEDDDDGERTAMVAFDCEGVHPSDLSTFLDMEGVAIRAGHHCCQPLHRELGLSHSARASLYFYNTKKDVDVFIEKLQETLNFFRGTVSGSADGIMGDGEKDDDIFI